MMAQANKLDSVLNAMRRPAERKAWRDYRPIFLKPERVEAAKGFMPHIARHWSVQRALTASPFR